VVQEAFINGVSTRKMERLTRSLGIEGISAGQVLVMTKELDDQITRFEPVPWRVSILSLGGCPL